MDEQKNESAHESQGKVEQIKEKLQEKVDVKAATKSAKEAARGFHFSNLFSGRLDSLNYTYYVIASLILGAILGMIPLIGVLAWIAFVVVGLGVSVRRLHDIGVTGWASLLLLIPFVGVLGVIY